MFLSYSIFFHTINFGDCKIFHNLFNKTSIVGHCYSFSSFAVINIPLSLGVHPFINI